MWSLLGRFWTWLTQRDHVDSGVRENFTAVTDGWQKMADRLSAEIDRLTKVVERLDTELDEAKREREECEAARVVDRERIDQLEARIQELEG